MTLAAVSKSASQMTVNGHYVMNRVDISSAAIQKNSHVQQKSQGRRNIGQFTLQHDHKSTYGRLDVNVSLTCRNRKTKFTLTRTSHGARTRCSLWNSELMRMENMRCIRATTSEWRENNLKGLIGVYREQQKITKFPSFQIFELHWQVGLKVH